MITFTFNGEEQQFPENWQEVKPRLLPVYLQMLFTQSETQKTYHELLRLSLGYSPRRWKRFCQVFFSPKLSEEKRERNAELLAFLLGRLSWMWTSSLTTQPFDQVRIGTQIYLLPDPALKTLTYGELTDAYIHMRAYVDQLEPGERRLHLLLATICRPENAEFGYETKLNWNGDKREPYNEHIAESRAELWEMVPAEKKVPILVYFVSILKTLFDSYELHSSETADSQSQEDYPGQGFIKNQHLLAEKGVFGTIHETRKTNAHDILLFLEESKKDEDYEEKKRQQAKHKNQ